MRINNAFGGMECSGSSRCQYLIAFWTSDSNEFWSKVTSEFDSGGGGAGGLSSSAGASCGLWLLPNANPKMFTGLLLPICLFFLSTDDEPSPAAASSLSALCSQSGSWSGFSYCCCWWSTVACGCWSTAATTLIPWSLAVLQPITFYIINN